MWTIENDEHCRKAEETLLERHLTFKNIAVERMNQESVIQALEFLTGFKKLPIVFFGMEHIGGAKELKDIINSGELERLLEKHTIKIET